jgi:hypothetical protein
MRSTRRRVVRAVVNYRADDSHESCRGRPNGFPSLQLLQVIASRTVSAATPVLERSAVMSTDVSLGCSCSLGLEFVVGGVLALGVFDCPRNPPSVIVQPSE